MHFHLTPVIMFALVLTLKNDFAAQTYVGSDFCIFIKVYDVYVDPSQLMLFHWLYEHFRLNLIGPVAFVVGTA